jgi:hypothetical protein
LFGYAYHVYIGSRHGETRDDRPGEWLANAHITGVKAWVEILYTKEETQARGRKGIPGQQIRRDLWLYHDQSTPNYVRHGSLVLPRNNPDFSQRDEPVSQHQVGWRELFRHLPVQPKFSLAAYRADVLAIIKARGFRPVTRCEDRGWKTFQHEVRAEQDFEDMSLREREAAMAQTESQAKEAFRDETAVEARALGTGARFDTTRPGLDQDQTDTDAQTHHSRSGTTREARRSGSW